LRIPWPLITIKLRSNDKIPELMMKMEDFSEKYRLGENILDLLQCKGFQCPGALLHVYDTQLNTNPHTGEFKVGHIAELRWALKKMAGKEVKETHVGTTELYGAPAILLCPAITSNLMFLRRLRRAGWMESSCWRRGWDW
jgi:hypothetical protein